MSRQTVCADERDETEKEGGYKDGELQSQTNDGALNRPSMFDDGWLGDGEVG